jgi:uncharacterized protein YndB with AHSA1/START domain
MTSHAPVVSLRSTDNAGIVHIELRFEADIEDVWSALTDPRRLGEWLGELEGDLRLGVDLRARFFATGWEGTLHVEGCERPERLLIVTRSVGEPDCVIEVTLAADADQTTAVFEDRGLPLDQIAAYGGGDQVLVEDLAAHLGGLGRRDARARWEELHPGYQLLVVRLAND